MMDHIPDIVQVVPRKNHTVYIYFADGKTVCYDVKPKLKSGVFRSLDDIDVFMNSCKIMNDTLAWDVNGNNDPTDCIDVDPYMLYSLNACADPLAEECTA